MPRSPQVIGWSWRSMLFGWRQREEQRTEELEGPVEAQEVREEEDRHEDLNRGLPAGEWVDEPSKHDD
jgi:hypothetical protein